RMKRAVRRGGSAVVLALVLVARSEPARADPVEAALLNRIASILQAIERFRMEVLDKLEQKIQTRVHDYAFPIRAFDQIRAAATRVADIREEGRQLACDWSFSARTRVLQEALLRKLRLCRSGFEDIWGSHDGLWDEEIQEMDDYIGAMTTNMISERAEKTNTSWIRVFRDTFNPQAGNGSTPGEANRAEA